MVLMCVSDSCGHVIQPWDVLHVVVLVRPEKSSVDGEEFGFHLRDNERILHPSQILPTPVALHHPPGAGR